MARCGSLSNFASLTNCDGSEKRKKIAYVMHPIMVSMVAMQTLWLKLKKKVWRVLSILERNLSIGLHNTLQLLTWHC